MTTIVLETREFVTGRLAYNSPSRMGARCPAPPAPLLHVRCDADGPALAHRPPADNIRALKMPMLILAYDVDQFHPLVSALYLKRLLPQAELHTVANKDDIKSQLEWPGLIAAFLRRRE